MSLQLAAASNVYVHVGLKEKEKKAAVVVYGTTEAGKCTEFQSILAGLNFQSVSLLFKHFTRLSLS